jgi:murein DD-endopeptidase MepM/ murein hydrolase activator NlpD
MNRAQGALFLLLLGIILVVAVVVRPASDRLLGGSSISISLSPTAGPSVSIQSTESASRLSPYVETAAVVTPAMPFAEILPSSTPPSAYAFQLQELEPPPTASISSPIPGWNPPPLEIPIAHHPFDHYWLIRPVASNYNNSGLYYYPYGSNGPANDLRIHHGVDLANPIGVEVHAAGAGTVIWADRGHFNEYESITAYGNTVVIQHDFGYQGQPIYTLYAHLSAILVRRGDRVEAGQVIGLIGNTGQVSGPHVHFEVRVGRNSYFAVRNPELWMAPYSGTGVIAGRVVFDNGRAVEDVPITVINLATGQVVARTTSYAGFGVNADDHWNENFVIADIPTGHYLVTANLNASSNWSGEVEVLPGVTNWVEMQFYIPGASEEGATLTPPP